MKRMRKSLRGHFWKRVISYALMVCLVMHTSVPTLMALTAGNLDGTPTGVDTTLVTWGDHTIIPADHGAIINWNDFNTTDTQSVTFNQPNAFSAVLNRINSGVATQFNGALNANGRVFVVNPAGVIFGGGATVNVAQLVVSGLGMTDDAFTNSLTGADLEFTGGSGNVTVESTAALNATEGIVLVGKKILNIGSIVCPNGLIILAAGETAYIAQDGSNVMVEVSEGFYGEDTTPDIENRSLIAADTGGKIVLAAGDVFSRAISNPGGLTARKGTIEAHAAVINSMGRIRVSAANPGGGGTIELTATEEINLQEGTVPGMSVATADAALHDAGGSITLECTNEDGTGTVTIEEGYTVTARGGSADGDGGTIEIIADHFVVEGDVDASPQVPGFENGTLTVRTTEVTVADGANAGATDTMYEEDIEALSQGDPAGGATDLIVHADESITVQDILDDLIDGGRGDVEFHAPTIHFEDTVATDTLSTTTGDIVMAGGAGGINTGHLQTGATGLADEAGVIDLSTTDGGDITTRDLTVKGGQTEGTISAVADGKLEVGTVHVGSGSPIDNGGSGGDALAQVYLESGDDMVLNGPVTAEAETADAGNPSATIEVFAGVNGDVSGLGDATINEDLLARAESTGGGTSYALVEVDTFGEIEWGPDADATAIGDNAQVLGVRETQDDTDGADEAHVIINERNVIPDLVPSPDEAETHMGLPVDGNVLANDVDSEERDIDVDGYTDPANGTLTLDAETGEFTYTPNEGFVGEDTFTYTATNGEDTSAPVTVTVTIGNNLPVPQNDVASTLMNREVQGNVLNNDTDPDGDPLAVVLNGTAPANGKVFLNADGSFTYTPDAGFVGEDTFTYNATDGQLEGTSGPVVVTGTVTITVQELPVSPVSPVAPGLERREIEYSGCPALAKWVAKELGVSEANLEIGMANALASSRDIQPFETYAKLRTAAVILKDISGTHIAALTQVVNEFASSTAPPTEEQMASIADAISSNAGADNHYGIAEEYLNALAQYISILNTELGFSMDEAVQFATANYVNQLANRGNANVAAYVSARLAEL